jgi:hypothetical protein
MKRAGKILYISLGIFCLLLVVGISFTIGWRPFIGPRKRAVTPGAGSFPDGWAAGL